MNSKTEERRHIYKEKFDPRTYLKFFANKQKRTVVQSELFFNTSLHDAFKEGQFKGSRCLDVGGGPIVHRLAIASKFCDLLYHSDFLKANCDCINQFLSSPDFSDPEQVILLEGIAPIEGFENHEAGAKIIETRLRSKLRGSIYCDVLEESPVGDLGAIGGPLDVVISNGCVETACSTLEELNASFRNISTLLRKEGAFMLMTYLDEDYYEIDGSSFPCFRVLQQHVEDGLKKAGFEIAFVKYCKDVDPKILEACNTAGFLFVLCYKR